MANYPSVTGFSELNYRTLLLETVSQYKCVGFDILAKQELPDQFAILRHDIDFSPIRALALAKIEAEVGIKSSYTVLLTGEYYNPFEKKVQQTLIEIDRLGHHVGLHFDAAWYSISREKDLEDSLSCETKILKRLLEKKEDMAFFSFHNTTPFTMECKERSYAGLWNAYAGILQSEVQYTSDSNGYWIHRSWNELLSENHKRIQVLTHPEWWCKCDAEPGEKIAKAIFDRALQGWGDYDELLRKLGRINVTGLGESNSGYVAGEDLSHLRFLWLCGFKEMACVGALVMVSKRTDYTDLILDQNVKNLLYGTLSQEHLKELFEKCLNILVVAR
nr:hypothetical protein [uncultured Pseudomonas sp.]